MPKKTKAIKFTDLKADKPWLKKVITYKYPIDSIEKKKRFLIVCEGQTEELYFKSFPVLTADVRPVHQGCSKSSLVECVAYYLDGENYDEIWCVFDMDYKIDEIGQYEDFDKAIQAAHQAGYKCAYSNDSFELWFVLHYQYIDQQQLRTFFFQKLSHYWELNYEKNGKQRYFATSTYKRLLDDPDANQSFAIKNARKLFESQSTKKYHLQNPVTTAYLLVEELNLHLRK
jgi:RloB-like protein